MHRLHQTAHTALVFLFLLLLVPNFAQTTQTAQTTQQSYQLYKIVWLYLNQGELITIQCSKLCLPDEYRVMVYQDVKGSNLQFSQYDKWILNYRCLESNRYIVMIMAKSNKCGCLIDVYKRPKPDTIGIIIRTLVFVITIAPIFLFIIYAYVTRNTNQNNLHNPEPILTDRQLLPVPAPAPNEICCICLDSQCNISLKNCGHYFHQNCIIAWVRIQKNCPHCRTVIQMRGLGVGGQKLGQRNLAGGLR